MNLTKPLIKRSHHIIKSEDGNICIGEIPGYSKIIKNPPLWVEFVLNKLDGKHTIQRILKELKSEFSNITEIELNQFIAALNEFKLLEDNTNYCTSLNNEEIERYDRQMLQFSLIDNERIHPHSYQERLKNASIVVFGLGGWGTWCSLQLSLLGIGQLKLIDGDTVELSNLNRQVLYNTNDIGKFKVDAAKSKIYAQNPHVNVITYNEFAENNLERLTEYIDGTQMIVIAWASLGYFKKTSIEESIHKIAHEKKIPTIELGGDPLEISVGPIYMNDTHENKFLEIKKKVRNNFYSKNSDIKKLQEARFSHSFMDGNRTVNAWQSAPSLAVMSGIVSDQIVKVLTNYDKPYLIGKRICISMQDFKIKEEVLF